MQKKDTVEGLWRERYARPAEFSPSTNETLATLLSHRSVRAYADKPVAAETLSTIVGAAQSASTSSNLQTWSVVAVQDGARKARLAELVGHQPHVRDCPLFLAWLADLSRLKTLGQQREVQHESLDFLEMFLVASIDASLAAQNAATAAESMGLGVVYIGGLRNHPEQVASELGLPANVFAVFGMCIGYPDELKPAAIKPRLSQNAVLHHEQYDDQHMLTEVHAYNGVMAEFYEEQKMRTKGPWDLHSLARVKGPEAMKGRDRLFEALNGMGFPLR